jgi:type VI secretion system protein ImpM
MTEELLPLAVGWYGKLPSRGDFVGRGLPAPWLETWDGWLQRGLAGAARQLGADVLRARLPAMPPWQCVVLPAASGEPAWCGVVVPSTDRVGRAFPLLLAEAYEEAALDRVGLVPLQTRALGVADWLDRIGALSSPRAFDAGVARWAATGWRGAPSPASGPGTLAELRQAAPHAQSFWWRPEPLGPMVPPLAEAWPPRESLVLDWVKPAPPVWRRPSTG